MNNDFYTYVYLDKTKSGNFQYENLTFDYLPRYVGKGTGYRAYVKHKHNIGLSVVNSNNIKTVFLDENLTDEKSREKEIEYIALIGRLDLNKGPLFNKTDGGDGVSGRIVSEETKEKISNSLQGEKHPMFGKHLSKEHREKVGRKGVRNHFFGVMGKYHPKYGKYHSKETKKKQSESLKGKHTGEENAMYGLFGKNNPSSKEYIIITPNNKILNIVGLNQFCKENNLYQGSMSNVANKKIKYSKGYFCFHVPGILYQKQL